MTEHSSDLLVFGLVVLFRFVVPLFIPRFPLPAVVVAMIADAVDQTIFQNYAQSLDLAGYQTYDKALDIYYLSIAYISTMRNWTNLAAFEVSRFLYFYRLVGVLIFELTQTRAVLLIFPNTFEYFFIAIEAIRTKWNPRRLTRKQVIYLAAFIWIFIKLPQEYWIHVAQKDVTDTLKANPGLGALLAIAIAGLLIFAWWWLQNKAPAADWGFRLDANKHEQDVTPAEASIARQQIAKKFFDFELLEKVVMISIISIIFGRILPTSSVSDLELAGAIAAIILLSTLVSEWLARRGNVWESAISSFVVTVVINTAIVLITAWLTDSRRTGDEMSDAAVFFFVILLSLLVTLYDRYRPIYLVREKTEGVPKLFGDGDKSLRDIATSKM